MLQRQIVVDKIEVLEQGHLLVRESTYIVEDLTGERIAGPSHRRQSFAPGDELPQGVNLMVRKLSEAVWTPEVVAAYRERLAKAVDASTRRQ